MDVLQVSGGKLEAHEHLKTLKAGDCFAGYKAQYAFPEMP